MFYFSNVRYQWLSVHKSEAFYIDFWSSRQENWVVSRKVQWPATLSFRPRWHTEMQRETVGGKKWQKNYRRYEVWQTVKQKSPVSLFSEYWFHSRPSSNRLGAIGVLPLLFPVSYSCSALHAKQDAAVPWREREKKKKKKKKIENVQEKQKWERETALLM